jgi:fatty acid desaturase
VKGTLPVWSVEEEDADGRRLFTAKELAHVSPVRPLLELALTWALLAAAIGVYLRHPAPWVFALTFVLVASRQYALLILMHDAFHALLHPRRRVNDLLGLSLIGAPCGSSYWPARSAHLEHHRKLGHPDDPELFLHSAGRPREKRTRRAFALHFARLVLGEQLVYTHLGPHRPGAASAPERWRGLFHLAPVALAQGTLFGLFTLAGSWVTYFTLWLLPLVTLAVLFNGVRAFCDHANPCDEPGDKSRRLVSYVSGSLERFFLAPFHMNFHAEHHLFPYVPHYNLPALRQRLQACDPPTTIQWRAGYLSFVRQFLRARGRALDGAGRGEDRPPPGLPRSPRP